MISSAAAMIACAFFSSSTFSPSFTSAAACLMIASAVISSGDCFSLEILKFCSERCVCAPQSFAFGTAISPKVSFSIRTSPFAFCDMA